MKDETVTVWFSLMLPPVGWLATHADVASSNCAVIILKPLIINL